MCGAYVRALALARHPFVGPTSTVQWAPRGGPYITASQVQQRQVVWPPPWPLMHATCPTRTWFAASECPFEQRSGARTIHLPEVDCTSSPIPAATPATIGQAAKSPARRPAQQ
jgi:hypothetical protein